MALLRHAERALRLMLLVGNTAAHPQRLERRRSHPNGRHGAAVDLREGAAVDGFRVSFLRVPDRDPLRVPDRIFRILA